MPERQRRNGGHCLAFLSALAGCVRREDAVLRQQDEIEAEHSSGEEEADSMKDSRRSLTLQPTAFPEVESLLEGLRKRLRMPAAGLLRTASPTGLPAINYEIPVKEKNALTLLIGFNREEPEVPGFLTGLEAVGS